MTVCAADNKEAVPRKDYDDYSNYINESYMSRRDLLRGGVERADQLAVTTRTARSTLQRHPKSPTLDILSTKSTRQNFFNSKSGFSVCARTTTSI